MTIRVGDIGKDVVLFTKIDMSASTALTMVFTKPDGTKLTKTNPDVTAPASPLVDPILGTLPANEYLSYTLVSSDIDQTGLWTVCGTYADSIPTHLSSASNTFTVLAGCS